MGKTFYDYFSNDGKNTVFGLPATTELVGRSARLPDGAEVRFGDELAVKCDNDLFLVQRAGKLLFVEELPDESLTARDAEQLTAGADTLPEDFCGWKPDISFASGYVLTASFEDGALTLIPSPEPVISAEGLYKPDGSLIPPTVPEDADLTPLATLPLEIAVVGENRFLLRFPETGEIVFFDGRRYLFYAILRGRIVAGFAELPPLERRKK